MLEHNKGQVSKAKADAKKKLKEAADVQMGDDPMNSDEKQQIEDIVNRKIVAALSKLKISNDKKGALLCGKSNSHINALVPRQKCNWEEESEESSREGEETSSEEEAHPCKRKRIFRTTFCQLQEAEREREEVKKVEDDLKHVSYGNPSTYPNSILNIPTRIAICLLIRIAPPEVKRVAKIYHNVHIGPGVILDTSICRMLGVGL